MNVSIDNNPNPNIKLLIENTNAAVIEYTRIKGIEIVKRDHMKDDYGTLKVAQYYAIDEQLLEGFYDISNQSEHDLIDLMSLILKKDLRELKQAQSAVEFCEALLSNGDTSLSSEYEIEVRCHKNYVKVSAFNKLRNVPSGILLRLSGNELELELGSETFSFESDNNIDFDKELSKLSRVIIRKSTHVISRLIGRENESNDYILSRNRMTLAEAIQPNISKVKVKSINTILMELGIAELDEEYGNYTTDDYSVFKKITNYILDKEDATVLNEITDCIHFFNRLKNKKYNYSVVFNNQSKYAKAFENVYTILIQEDNSDDYIIPFKLYIGNYWKDNKLKVFSTLRHAKYKTENTQQALTKIKESFQKEVALFLDVEESSLNFNHYKLYEMMHYV